MGSNDVYEVYAIRYAASPYRKRFHACLHCAAGDAHDLPMPMDFYIWVVKNAHRTFVIDTGSREWKCVERGHEFIRCPAEGLRAINIDPDRVDDLILTHLHWDHAGNVDKFSNASIHLQKSEMLNIIDPSMAEPRVNAAFLVDDVCTLVHKLFDGKLRYHKHSRELAPGISIHEVGGHSAGLQVVRVFTQRGWIVLASDAAHFYLNYQEKNPFPIMYNYPDTLLAMNTCVSLAETADHVIPGHDPLVLRRYPAVSSALEGDVVRLDLDPINLRA